MLFVGNSDYDSLLNARAIIPHVETIFDVRILSNRKVGYISICDHTHDDFVLALESATEIYYIQSTLWEHEDSKIKTEYWLRHFSYRKPVHNLPVASTLPLLDLIDQRKSPGPQLWAAGCSLTAGYGINENERWGQLVANKLNMPVTFLAKSGASINWAADQILRSDIKKNDIVVWGLSSIGRVSYYNGKTFDFLVNSPSSDKVISMPYVRSPHLFYQSLTNIAQVIRRSEDIGFVLVIVVFPFFNNEQGNILYQYLSNFKCFIPLNTDFKFIDYAPIEKDHPGPLQHQFWAETILKTLDYLL